VAVRFTAVPKQLPISMLTFAPHHAWIDRHRAHRDTGMFHGWRRAPTSPNSPVSRLRSRVVTSLQASLKVGGYDIFRWQLCRSCFVNSDDLVLARCRNRPDAEQRS